MPLAAPVSQAFCVIACIHICGCANTAEMVESKVSQLNIISLGFSITQPTFEHFNLKGIYEI